MAIIYKPSQVLLDKTIELLKKNRYISGDVYIIPDSNEQPKKYIYYHDLLGHMAMTAEKEVVTEAVRLLADTGIEIPEIELLNHNADKFRDEMKEKVNNVPWSPFSASAQRFVYMLSYIKRPKKMLCIGIGDGGIVLFWNLGFLDRNSRNESVDRILGIENTSLNIEKAKANLKKVFMTNKVELLDDSALQHLEDDSYDYVLIDAYLKSSYIDIVKDLYPKLKKGGWLLAHDAIYPKYRANIDDYLSFVRDKKNFSESICFEFDSNGLELSIK
ncbi:MAG: class I SAM-dependent methyltransferase [Clostridia bacterium]|nr:class I SAM-dependent methyltransferase [Clostridia bacterium]